MASDLRSVYVEWLDHVSHSDAGWKRKEDIEEMEPVVMKTLGFVVNETSDFITLVSSLSTNEECDMVDGDICIIKPAVIKLVNVVEQSD